MEIYAPDTNFFLQCQPADKIDWKRVTAEDEVVLLVVREVRKELDRLKSGGNQRRAKKARAASAVLRRLTTEGIQEIELRTTAPRVLLRAAQRPPASSLPIDYRIETADERIVAEAYALKETVGDRVTFLSHDTVPLEDAAGLGLKTQVVPEEWLLDPEPSEVERELADVRRRMKVLEGRSPDIVVEIPTDPDGHIRLKTDYFLPLPNAFLSAATGAVRAKHAIDSHSEPHFRIGGAFAALQKVSDERWAAYLQEHANWLDAVEFALGDAWRFMNEDPNSMKLPLTITNKGSAGAENLIVRIRTLGDFHMVNVDALEHEDDPTRYFPEPPSRPQGGIFDTFANLGRVPYAMPLDVSRHLDLTRLSTPPMARDRHTIYWEYDDDRHATSVEGQCRDFRHGLRPDELVLSLERLAIGDEPLRGAIEILVSAGNLAEPQQMMYPVHIETELIDTEALIRKLLKRELDVDF
ncbi:PIN domain-containing protein [Lysobacter cavernae]|uniref:PIN domain-containing protein n=1 Tax=Lysobacter cavernae TaxID=1685901 RepID=A0ABV7RMW2_9GAMM